MIVCFELKNVCFCLLKNFHHRHYRLRHYLIGIVMDASWAIYKISQKYVVVIRRLRVQYEKYFTSSNFFRIIFSEPLGEENMRKKFGTSKIFLYCTSICLITGLSETQKIFFFYFSNGRIFHNQSLTTSPDRDLKVKERLLYILVILFS